MNATELLQTLQNITRIPKATAKEVLETAAEIVAEALREGDEASVKLPGFGTFKARTGKVADILQLNLRDPEQSRLVGGHRRARLILAKTFRDRVDNRGA